jgi:hypothetical protein
VGTCCYVLSYLALNDLATRGSRLFGHLPGTGNPQVWISGAQACVKLGHKVELDRANRWVKSCPPTTIEGGLKGLVRIVPGFNFF